jgi:hypothetical protein
MTTHEKLECLFRQGLIVFPKKPGGQPMYKQYMGEGVPYQDIWAYQPNTHGVLHGTDECIDEDVKYLESEQEKLGFQTQKPTGLLQRILITSSDEGDLVLDPFCGCGTTIEVAERLKRRWIGIDITRLAVALMKHRLNDAFGSSVSFKVVGEPVSVTEAEALAKEDPYQFQWWALGMVGARPVEEKKGADKGIDGRLFFHDEGGGGKTKQIIFQVKAGHVTAAHVRDLRGVVEREKAQIGILITRHEPTLPMRTEAARAGFYDSPWGTKHARIQIVPVRCLFEPRPIDAPPLRQTNVTFKRAPRVRESQASADFLPFSDKK